MIELRVDDRLIHGQVVLLWTKQLNLKGIIVANDAAANSKVQQTSLKMAAPQGVNVLVNSLDDAIKVLQDERSKKMNIMILCRSVYDAWFILKNVNIVDRVNIANVGRFDGVNISEKHKISSTIYLDSKDYDSFLDIQLMDIKMVHQISPDSNEKNLKEIKL